MVVAMMSMNNVFIMVSAAMWKITFVMIRLAVLIVSKLSTFVSVLVLISSSRLLISSLSNSCAVAAVSSRPGARQRPLRLSRLTQRAQYLNEGIWLKLYRASYYDLSHIPN